LNRRLSSLRAEIDEIYRRRDEKEKRVIRAKDEVKRLKAERRPKQRDIEEAKETVRRRSVS
jgi:peptidoglycan hydrolase CwlO-like protein